jgi:hypothetical protein
LSNRQRKREGERQREADVREAGTVTAFSVLAYSLLHMVDKKRHRMRPDSSYRCTRGQPPPQTVLKKRNKQRVKGKEKIDLMAVGAVPAVQVLNLLLCMVVEKEELTERQGRSVIVLIEVGAVFAVPVLPTNQLHMVVEKEEEIEKRKEINRHDGSWHCTRSLCPRTQPPPCVKERGTDREKDRYGEVDMMAVGAVSAVPVLAPNLLHVVEKRNRQRER